MIFIAITISVLSLFAVSYITYYAFIQKPNRLIQLNEAIKRASTLKENLIDEITNYNNEKENLKKSIEEFNQEFSEMKRKMTDLNNQLSNSNKELSEAYKLKKTILTEVQTLRTDIEKISDTQDTITQQIAILKPEVQNLEKQKRDALVQITEFQKEFVQVKRKVEELRATRTNLENQNSELSEMLEVKKNSSTVETYKVIEENSSQGKVVNYIPNDKFQKDGYPYVSMPKENCKIQFPRKVLKHILPTGYKDLAFADELSKHFASTNTSFFTDRILVASSKKSFEPDIAAIDEKSGVNLFIDIEIDEPYESIGRFPTHCIGDDVWRNNFFNERGWMVIRFTEKQVHQYPAECCRFIANVIQSVNPSYKIPLTLSSVVQIQNEPFWDKLQAEKWQEQFYREKYLNHTFKATMDSSKLILQELDLTEEEISIAERLSIRQNATVETGRWWNKANQHARDSRIEFNAEKHEYYVDGIKDHISATTLIKRFFKEFDALSVATSMQRNDGIDPTVRVKGWKDDADLAAKEGTALHNFIEDFFEKSTAVNTKEFMHFLNFYQQNLESKVPYRTEWRIFDNYNKVAGTADFILRKTDGTFAIYDWKRSKQIKMNGHPDYYTKITQKGIGQLNNIEDCNYVHYCLQLNIYKRILEQYYIPKPVTEMYFVQLHPKQEKANIFEVPDMQNVVGLLFSSTIYRN